MRFLINVYVKIQLLVFLSFLRFWGIISKWNLLFVVKFNFL